MFRSNSLIVD